MSFLMFVPLFMLLFITIGLGAITATIAKRKHRSRALWWVAGSLGFPIALIAILCFQDFDNIPENQKSTSVLKERIVLAFVVMLWLSLIAMRILAVLQ